jgi:hypothetical protein
MGIRLEPKFHDSEGLRLLHLKLVGKVALSTAVAAAIILFLMVFLVSEDTGASYLEVIQSYTLTRAHLRPVMALAALLLLMLVGLSVGLIALYTSFRIAGPLYRLAQNLQATGPLAHLQGIRQDDALHGIAADLRTSVDTLEHHYQQLRVRVEATLALATEADVEPHRLNKALADLKAVEAAVRLDE